MKKKVMITLIVLLALVVFVFSSPVRAIKAGALMQGCDFFETISAKFEKVNDSNPNSWGDKYEADSALLDRTTCSGHSTWYVHRVLFINIPTWAGNG